MGKSIERCWHVIQPALIGGLESDVTNGISYEQLLMLIEEVLQKSDYYKMPSTDHHTAYQSQPFMVTHKNQK